MSNYTGRRAKINSVLDVIHVKKRISGRKKQINTIAKNIGSSYGLMRAILYDSSAIFLGIANQNYTVSKTTGLSLNRKRISTSLSANILFMMGRIFIKKGV